MALVGAGLEGVRFTAGFLIAPRGVIIFRLIAFSVGLRALHHWALSPFHLAADIFAALLKPNGFPDFVSDIAYLLTDRLEHLGVAFLVIFDPLVDDRLHLLHPVAGSVLAEFHDAGNHILFGILRNIFAPFIGRFYHFLHFGSHSVVEGVEGLVGG